ncbi:MAG: flagellar protein FlbB [Treponema sp.]|uniref:periplasmic-type flagellar collar protein FlbB n=1 Tax=Treponema sp. TaxID=166 RepID=UPI0025DCB409|nr:flagellar protein FlbB [Treponema sp.]MBQ9282975.1 flagellar protein FlbB [Treponema sp.]
MARGNGGIGKTIFLLILIIILVLGGLLWFDYLGVIHAKKMFAPAYKLVGLAPQTSVTATTSKPLTADLDEDRLAKRIEALDIRKQELDKRESDIVKIEEQNEAIAKELEDRKKSQDEREKTFNNQVKKYDDRNTNIETIASYLNSMPPKTAVEELLSHDDQDIIDILRKADEMAAANKQTSLSSVWLMNMPAERAATIQRKMANKPESLD